MAGILAICASVQGALYTHDVNAVIPDNSIVGLTDSQVVSGVAGTIADIQVSLNISGGFNGDLYGYLRLNDGTMVVLVNRTGVTPSNPDGYPNTGLLVTLVADSTANDIHSYQDVAPVYNSGGQLTGTWQADGRATPLSFDRSSLSSFDGQDPNGTWTLFFADQSPGGESTLVSWSLMLTPIPEKVNVALLCLGGFALAIKFILWLRQRARQSSRALP